MPPRRSGPITAAKRRRILALHADGMTRNDIARTVKVSSSTVTKHVHDAGGTFDRSATKAATAAKVADARSRRAELSLQLLEDAARLRAQIWQPHEYVDHGGRDFVEARWTFPEPTPQDKLKLMQAASAAIGRHVDIERHDADQQAAGVSSMLTELGRALGVQPVDQP